ncbi:serine hydrolase domain-containing protein [Nonomuraea thailandensis]
MAERVDEALRGGEAPHVHGVVVLRGGEVVLERYGAGEDHALNVPLGHVTFDRDTLHDLRSVSKSVVALVYGIALAEGLVPEPGASLVRQFPEYGIAGREHLTVEHALTMTLGLEWDEQLPYTDPANSEIAMELAPDRHRYVLERPVVEEAGKRWHYCGGATALIGEIITRGPGGRWPSTRRPRCSSRWASRPTSGPGGRRRHESGVRAAPAPGRPGRRRAARARRRPGHRARRVDRGDAAAPGDDGGRGRVRLPVVPR